MYHGGYKFGATQVLVKLNSKLIRIQVLIDGTEWTLRHLGDLRMPLLVLHGVEDEMVLVSGSR